MADICSVYGIGYRPNVAERLGLYLNLSRASYRAAAGVYGGVRAAENGPMPPEMIRSLSSADHHAEIVIEKIAAHKDILKQMPGA